MTGLFLVDKPPDITSHDVVDAVRVLTGEKKVGHAGTLDPFATGLLIILVGRNATRQQQSFLSLNKSYKATIQFGASSSTHDIKGGITESSTLAITQEQLETSLNQFNGTMMQMPPKFSAKKIGGKKAYELARQGKSVILSPKKVTISNIVLHSFSWPTATISMMVSSGTYIRALARDIGADLKTGAYLSSLRRTSIGPFLLESAHTLKNLSLDHLLDLNNTLVKLDTNSHL